MLTLLNACDGYRTSTLCRSAQMPNNSMMCGGKRATSSMLFEMLLNCKLWNAMSSQTPLLCKVSAQMLEWAVVDDSRP